MQYLSHLQHLIYHRTEYTIQPTNAVGGAISKNVLFVLYAEIYRTFSSFFLHLYGIY